MAFAALFISTISLSINADASPSNPQRNAYDYYVKAAAALPKNAPKSTFPKFDDGSPNKIAPYHSALERNEAVLKANARTLQLLRQGFAFPFKRPQQPYGFLGIPIHFYSQLRQIARVLMLESQVKAEKGDWAGAANSAVDGIRLGQDILHGSIIDTFFGRAIQDIVVKSLNNTLNHVDVTAARDVAARLERIFSNKVQYADVLEMEKQQSLWEYKQMAAAPEGQKEFSSKKSREESKSMLIKAMNSLITSARLPYPERDASIKLIKVPGGKLNQIIWRLYSDPKGIKAGIARGLPLTVQQTQNAFLPVEFALRGYWLKHGFYPISLKALVPNYLQKIPDDPFALRGPLSYKSDKKIYTLYSVGPDGKDDEGKPISGKRVFTDSKGDIIAGNYNGSR